MFLLPPTNADSRSLVSADGTRIYADAVGDSANPALIFTHGFGLGVEVFNDIFSDPEFSKDFYLIRYDQRGFGRSGKPDDFSSKRFAEDFDTVAKAFGAKKPILIGWSMGCRIFADIATHLPEGTLSGCVGIAGFPFQLLGHPAFEASRRPALGSYLMKWTLTNNPTVVHQCQLAFNRQLFSRDLSLGDEFFEDTVKKAAEGKDFVEENPHVTYGMRMTIAGIAATMPPHVHRAVLSRKSDNTKAIEFGKNGFPFCYVYGVHDTFANGEKVAEFLKPFFTNFESAAVEDSGHMLFIENPKKTMEPILRFARQVTC